MVFCPSINDECKLQECRAWSTEDNDCEVSVGSRLNIKYLRTNLANNEIYRKQLEGHARMTDRLDERDKREKVFSRLSLELLQRDPQITGEERTIIEEAVNAESTDEADHILRKAGLLGGPEPM